MNTDNLMNDITSLSNHHQGCYCTKKWIYPPVPSFLSTWILTIIYTIIDKCVPDRHKMLGLQINNYTFRHSKLKKKCIKYNKLKTSSCYSTLLTLTSFWSPSDNSIMFRVDSGINLLLKSLNISILASYGMSWKMLKKYRCTRHA